MRHSITHSYMRGGLSVQSPTFSLLHNKNKNNNNNNNKAITEIVNILTAAASSGLHFWRQLPWDERGLLIHVHHVILIFILVIFLPAHLHPLPHPRPRPLLPDARQSCLCFSPGPSHVVARPQETHITLKPAVGNVDFISSMLLPSKLRLLLPRLYYLKTRLHCLLVNGIKNCCCLGFAFP